VEFAGLQFSAELAELGPPPVPPAETWSPPGFLALLGVEVSVLGGVYPAPNGTTPGPLTLTLGTPTGPLPHSQMFYRLAVSVDGGSAAWDDPKIYDDGSQ
jgi:hypothetical protein